MPLHHVQSSEVVDHPAFPDRNYQAKWCNTGVVVRALVLALLIIGAGILTYLFSCEEDPEAHRA